VRNETDAHRFAGAVDVYPLGASAGAADCVSRPDAGRLASPIRGNYQAHRFSPLAQITRQNVAQLKPAWIYQVRRTGIVETTPIVADGVMYITEPPSTVTALDVRTGRPLWTYTPTIPTDVIVIGSPPVNRGVAILDDMVYVGTVDGHLIALDTKSGAVRWDIQVDDNKFGYYVTSGAAGARRADHHRGVGRGSGHSWLPRCLRSEDRQACVAHAHDSRAGANRGTRPGAATVGRPAAVRRG
jgi:alcohol dehydrogenase (cytochrome c)